MTTNIRELTYAVTVIIDDNLEIVSTGSCLHYNFKNAIDHARSEAIMIDTSHRESIEAKLQRPRYNQIRGSMPVINMFNAIESLENINATNLICIDIDKRLFDDTTISIIAKGDDFILVRAINKFAKDTTTVRISDEDEFNPFL